VINAINENYQVKHHMTNKSLSTTYLALIAAGTISFGSSVFAQSDTSSDTATDAEAGNEEEQSTQTQPGGDLSLGEDANAVPALGETYVRETIGDWQLQCLRTEVPEEDPCQTYQLLRDAEQAPVAEVTIFRLPEGRQAVAGATVIVPLETALQSQLTIKIDSGSARRYPYAFCNTVGCYARIGLTAEDIASYKRGSTAEVTIVPVFAPDQTKALTMSLSGFTKSFDLTSEASQ